MIPAADKAELLCRLLAAGFRRLDCASFVSPRAVPQMADSESVLERIAPVLQEFSRSGDSPELIGIVLNRRGLERALATPVTTLGFPLSLSPAFQWQNAHQSPAQADAVWRELLEASSAAGRDFVVYLSMAFGNPFGDPDSTEKLLHRLESLQSAGVLQVALADTAGQAGIGLILERFRAAKESFPGLELGLHLHSRPETSAEKIRQALAAGCRRFDAALGGMGGCPFAGDRLVGNLATEIAIAVLRAGGVILPFDAEKMQAALAWMHYLRAQYCSENGE